MTRDDLTIALAAGTPLAQAQQMRVTDIPAADDIAALQQRLAIEPALPYLDLRRAEALDRALARWPWLSAVRRHADVATTTGPA